VIDYHHKCYTWTTAAIVVYYDTYIQKEEDIGGKIVGQEMDLRVGFGYMTIERGGKRGGVFSFHVPTYREFLS
jgi:hypothetical protein